jgi:hypothetical protein
MSLRKIVVAFVPVLHEGYRKFFENNSDVDTLYIFGKDVVEEHSLIYKRRLGPFLQN